MLVFQLSNLFAAQTLGFAIGSCHIPRFSEVLSQDLRSLLIQQSKATLDSIGTQHITTHSKVIALARHQLIGLRRCIAFLQLRFRHNESGVIQLIKPPAPVAFITREKDG